MGNKKQIHTHKHTQNNAPFVAFYDMGAVTFFLPDEMADVSIAGLQCFILIPRLNHPGSHKPSNSHSKPYLHQKKKIRFGTRITNLLQTYEIRGKQLLISHFSRLLQHAKEKSQGPILYTKKPMDPMWQIQMQLHFHVITSMLLEQNSPNT